MVRHIFLTILIIALTLGGSFLVKSLMDSELSSGEQIRNAEASGNYALAKNLYRELLETDPENPEYHRGYIRNHFRQPKRTGKSTVRDDRSLLEEYSALLSDSRIARDVILYGLGYYYVSLDDYDRALEYYLQVEDPFLPYLNNSIGYVFLQKKEYILAEESFLKEIRGGGNPGGAYGNLARSYFARGDLDSLTVLLENPEAIRYIEPSLVYKTWWLQKHFLRYLRSRALLFFTGFIWQGLLAGLLIAAVWLIFFHRVDVFEPEKIGNLLLCFFMGVLFAFPGILLYDIWELAFRFTLNGRVWNDLLYCVFGIGFIEELVKLIPLGIFLLFTREVNESADLIIYASLGALGFATIENLHYFSESGLKDIVGRALSSVILHMSLSSLAVYGGLRARYRRSGAALPSFLLTFFLAMVLHGVYDFFLVSAEPIRQFSLFSTLILILAMVAYSAIIRNALGQSEYFSKEHGDIRLAGLLYYGILAVLMYQTAVLTFKFGRDNALLSLLRESLSGYLLAWYLIRSFGLIPLRKGVWAPLATFGNRGRPRG